MRRTRTTIATLTTPAMLATLVAGFAAPMAQVVPASSPPVPRVDSCATDFLNNATAMLADYLQKSRAPGVAVAFFDNGKACVFVSGV
jgi:hypothetical protein